MKSGMATPPSFACCLSSSCFLHIKTLGCCRSLGNGLKRLHHALAEYRAVVPVLLEPLGVLACAMALRTHRDILFRVVHRLSDSSPCFSFLSGGILRARLQRLAEVVSPPAHLGYMFLLTLVALVVAGVAYLHPAADGRHDVLTTVSLLALRAQPFFALTFSLELGLLDGIGGVSL